MTNKEAIEWLNTDDYNSVGYGEAIVMAIKALEMQMPKKPIVEEPFLYYCPTCYEYEGNKDWKNKLMFDQGYCDACGQAIDWREVAI